VIITVPSFDPLRLPFAAKINRSNIERLRRFPVENSALFRAKQLARSLGAIVPDAKSGTLSREGATGGASTWR
jgi:hypothetical protein